MNSGSIASAYSTEKITNRNRAAPLREVQSAVFIPPLRSSSMPNKMSRHGGGDRFIPYRSSMDMDFARYHLTESKKEKENTAVASPSKEAYRKLLAEACLNNRTRILSFQHKPLLSSTNDGFLPESSFVSSHLVKSAKPKRYISQTAERTLDAPDIMDDYYLNLLDWGSSNVLSIALGNTIYLWDASKGSASELVTVEEDLGPVTSVSWAPDGQHIAVGLNNSHIQLWDSTNKSLLRTLRGVHRSRVGALSWNNNILTTGGMDGKIVNNDVRIRSHAVQTYRGHRQEVCGLKWSNLGQQLASGANDNLLHIWDIAMSSSNPPPGQNQYVHRFDDHNAAVKAIAWCPFQSNLLASGGGENDKCIKFWNTNTGACLNSINTGSQVCSLLWNTKERELLSSHGFTQNQLTLWKYPSMTKIAELTGHTSRVLFMAKSPDGCTVASAAGDETLRFWNVFGTPQVAKPTPKASSGPFCCRHSCGDRFIPARSSMDMDFAQHYLTGPRKEEENKATASPSKEAYRKLLAEICFGDRTRILAFKHKPTPTPPVDGFLPEFLSCNDIKSAKRRRCISQKAEKILEAPNIMNDYYLNLLDWGSSNVLAIALRYRVYLWNASNGSASKLFTVEEDLGPVTSVSWAPDGQHIAVGLNNSHIQLWDTTNNRLLRTLRGEHRSRVGALSWNDHILTTGEMNGKIVNNDVRIRSHAVQTYRGHTLEVCGLKWSNSGRQLASGGNDNLLHIWDISTSSSNALRNQNQYLHRFDDHNAAVKALAWCPFESNLLASGGGANDKCIKFWNTNIGSCLNSIDTGSQVCSLLWNTKELELLSSHGFTRNQLTLWKYPSMNKIAELTGHTSRVLFMAKNPDGCTVASAAEDETLRFWNVFGTPQVAKRAPKATTGPFSSINLIR